MTAIQPFEWALLAAIILGVAELITGGFVLLGFAVACLAVAGIEYLHGGLAAGRDSVVFVSTSLLAVILLRGAFARPGDTIRASGDVNDY